MSGKGIGGVEYDDLLEGIENHPREMPGILVCSQETMEKLIGTTTLSSAGTGFVGHVVGIPVWIDNRYEQPLFFSGLQ
jgi:hypothetical protein